MMMNFFPYLFKKWKLFNDDVQDQGLTLGEHGKFSVSMFLYHATNVVTLFKWILIFELNVNKLTLLQI